MFNKEKFLDALEGVQIEKVKVNVASITFNQKKNAATAKNLDETLKELHETLVKLKPLLASLGKEIEETISFSEKNNAELKKFYENETLKLSEEISSTRLGEISEFYFNEKDNIHGD